MAVARDAANEIGRDWEDKGVEEMSKARTGVESGAGVEGDAEVEGGRACSSGYPCSPDGDTLLQRLRRSCERDWEEWGLEKGWKSLKDVGNVE